MTSDMTGTTLEDVYAALADGIDLHGPDKETMFLAKVALLLAHELNDADRVCALIAAAQDDMEGMRPPEDGGGGGTAPA